jgi:alanine racemase
MLNILENTATRLQKPCVFHLKVNTGMTRLGVDWEESDTFLEDCSYCRWARCDGIFTHLGSAENVRSTVNQAQLNRFKDLLARINRPHRFSWCHAANSAAMINYRESWFNAVRPGLILYGIQPTEICDHNSTPISCEESWQGVLSTLRPVLSFKTRIMQIRKVRSGTAIGYGESFVTGRDSLIATLPVGYADGLLRALSNKGSVLVRGSQAPIVGRISMDLTTIDVTNIAAVQTGDDVVLIGRQSEKSIGAEDMAVQAGTIPYEIFCRIGNRVTRVYL